MRNRKRSNDMNAVSGQYGPDREGKKQGRRIAAVMILCILGIFLLLATLQNFLTALKPAVDIAYLLDHGAGEGMHVAGRVPYTYDCFADMTETARGRVQAYYYALPAAEGIIVLAVSPEKKKAMDILLEETFDYLESGYLPETVVEVEGYVEKARGRLPYLLSQYMEDIGYTKEEVEAMGEPLMIREAADSLHKARILAPVGMILLASGVLLAMFFVLCRKKEA